MGSNNAIKTKKCKYCQSDIPKKAKICPVCKKRVKTSVVGIIAIMFIVFLLGCVVIGSEEDIDKGIESLETAIEDAGYATMEKFNKIESGMTYDEVVEIMGSEGTVMTETTVLDTTTTIYYWYAVNQISNMNITISDGKVIAKAQIGLD